MALDTNDVLVIMYGNDISCKLNVNCIIVKSINTHVTKVPRTGKDFRLMPLLDYDVI